MPTVLDLDEAAGVVVGILLFALWILVCTWVCHSDHEPGAL